MRKIYLIIAACLLGLASCTDFGQEVAEDVLKVVGDQSVSVNQEGGLFTVVLKSGSKWDVTAPEWISISKINASSTPFEWNVEVGCMANNESYSRNGEIVFTAGSHRASVTVTQEGLPVVEVTNVVITEGEVNLQVGETKRLEAVVYPSDATDKTVSWKTSNSSIVSVSSNGVIEALKLGGPVTITATAGNKSDKCIVNVVVPVTGVTLDRNSLSLRVDDFTTLTATVKPSNATNKNVTWSSSNSNVATVNTEGRVVAIKEGNATITAKTEDGGFTATCAVTVTSKVVSVKGISIEPATADIPKNSQFQLKVVFDPENATNKSVKWKSSNESVATVDQNGLVKGLYGGVVTITATSDDGGKTATSKIKVVANTESIAINPKSLALHPGENATLSCTLSPDDANNYSLSWSSGNTAVATVNNGSVKAVATGSTYIKVIDANSGVSAECPVKVGNKVTGISVSPESLTIKAGETSQLTVSLSPGNLLDDTVEWSTTDSNVALVSDYGSTWATVKAVGRGTATLTVTSRDNYSVSKTVQVTVTGGYKQPKLIDLGLSVRWASFNLGADEPEVAGDYFAWGETDPKTEFSWSNYIWCNGSGTSLTKYNYKSSQGKVDDKYSLDPEDDAAYMAFGDKWRMPSAGEWDELIDGCSWNWSSKNGVSGYYVYSKQAGYTNNYIFIPVTGRWNGSSIIAGSTYGYYWSSDLYSTCADSYVLAINNSTHAFTALSRYIGLAIRPVYGDQGIPVTGVSLDKENLSLPIGGTERLYATVTPSNATNKKVVWSSDDESVATVDDSGLVTGMAKGTTTIRVKTVDGNYPAACEVSVTKDYMAPSAIDMGLTVKWGSFNLGATSDIGEGDYFAWGETKPKDDYSWGTYLWCGGSGYSLTKYNTSSTYGYVDNLVQLKPEDDAVAANLGGKWRMPSRGEIEDLYKTCSYTWVRRQGVYGMQFTGTTGRTIFLPATGYVSNTTYSSVGSAGVYATSSVYNSNSRRAYTLYVYNNSLYTDNYYRYYGLTIRPVYGDPYVAVTGISLDKTTLSVPNGTSFKLNATIAPSNASIQKVSWKSTDETVAVVDQNGNVQTTGMGDAEIKVTTQDGEFSASCSLTVTQSTNQNYEWFLGTWEVRHYYTTDAYFVNYWVISPRAYAASYTITGIDGYTDVPVVAYFDKSTNKMSIPMQEDICYAQVLYNDVYYNCMMSLYGTVNIDGKYYYYNTKANDILYASKYTSNTMRFTPNSVVINSKSYTFVDITMVGEMPNDQGRLSLTYPVTLPCYVYRYSNSYAPRKGAPAKDRPGVQSVEIKKISSCPASALP